MEEFHVTRRKTAGRRAVDHFHHAVHVATVLKAAPGQQVRVGILDGAFGTGTVTSVEPARVTMQCRFEEAAPASARR